MATFFGVDVWSTPILREKQGEVATRLCKIGRIERSQQRVGRNPFVERIDQLLEEGHAARGFIECSAFHAASVRESSTRVEDADRTEVDQSHHDRSAAIAGIEDDCIASSKQYERRHGGTVHFHLDDIARTNSCCCCSSVHAKSFGTQREHLYENLGLS